MTKSFAFVLVCVTAIGAAVYSACAAPKDGRKLVWSDEFDGAALDQSKWKFHQTMNSTDCVYVNDSRTARVEGGCLHLLVVPSGNPQKPQMLPRGVSTRDRMAFKYGYLEMRAKVPFRHGAWPSFWMTAQPRLQKASWMSEVDIFEVFSSSNAVVANLHKWAPGKRHFMLPGGEGCLKRAYIFKDCAKLNDEFHVYGFEWTQKEMSFLVDGEKYATFQLDEAHDYCPKEGLGMAGHHDFHNIHINNEIFTPGHSWCPKEKRIKADDKLPIDYYIDWIRLYQKDGEEMRKLPLAAGAAPFKAVVRPVKGDATAILQKAFDDCFRAGGGTVAVECGVYRVKGLRLRSNTTLLLRGGAAIKASRNSLPKKDWISGSHGVPGVGRRTMLSLFTYYSDFTIKVRHVPGEIVVRNCRLENAARFLHYNFSGNETWQKNRPLASLRFEGVVAKDVGMSLCAYGDGEERLSLALENCRVSFSKKQAEFVRGAHIASLVFRNVTVEGVDGPCVRSWGDVEKPDAQGLFGVGSTVEVSDAPFKVNPI